MRRYRLLSIIGAMIFTIISIYPIFTFLNFTTYTVHAAENEVGQLIEYARKIYNNEILLPGTNLDATHFLYLIAETKKGVCLVVSENPGYLWIYDESHNLVCHPESGDTSAELFYRGKYYEVFNHVTGAPLRFVDLFYPEEHHYHEEYDFNAVTLEQTAVAWTRDNIPITQKEFETVYEKYDKNGINPYDIPNGTLYYYHDNSYEVYDLKTTSQTNDSNTSTVDTVISHMNTWSKDEWGNDYLSYNENYRIGFLDLDFDGNLEFVIESNQGSGLYTYLEAYRITGNEMQKLSFNQDENMRFPDFDYKILKDESGTKGYYGNDIERGGAEYKSDAFCSIIYNPQSRCFDVKTYCIAEEQYNRNTNQTDSKYRDCTSGSEINKDQYENIKSNFESKYTDLHLKYEFIPLESLAEPSFRDKLTASYNKFSYDGYKSSDAIQDGQNESVNLLTTQSFYEFLDNNGGVLHSDTEFSLDELNSPEWLKNGILGAYIGDLNNDGKEELITASLCNLLDTIDDPVANQAGDPYTKCIRIQVYQKNESSQVFLDQEFTICSFNSYGLSLPQTFRFELYLYENENKKYLVCNQIRLGVGNFNKVTVLSLDKNNKFIVERILLDPGYASGVGLYQIDNATVNEILSIDNDYIKRGKTLYEVEQGDGVAVDEMHYFKAYKNALSPFDIQVESSTAEDSYKLNDSLFSTLSLPLEFHDESLIIAKLEMKKSAESTIHHKSSGYVPRNSEDAYENFIQRHMTNAYDEAGLWCDSYLNAPNELKTAYLLLANDLKSGALGSALGLDGADYLLSFDWDKIFDTSSNSFFKNPLTPEAYYNMLLLQMLSSSYDTEELLEAVRSELLNIITEYISPSDTNDELKSNLFDMKLDVLDLTDSIRKAKSLTELFNICDNFSLPDAIDIISIIPDTYNFITDKLSDKFKTVVLCLALLNISDQAVQLFQEMRIATTDDKLAAILAEYIKVLDNENFRSAIINKLMTDITSTGFETLIHLYEEMKETAANIAIPKIIEILEDELGLPNIVNICFIGCKLVIKLENLASDYAFETKELYETTGGMIACGIFHQTLAVVYQKAVSKLSSQPEFENAELAHYAAQSLKAVDLKAIEYAKDYIPRFADNNLLYDRFSAIITTSIIPIIPIMSLDNDLSQILNCNSSEIYQVLAKLPNKLDQLESQYTAVTCCDRVADWQSYIIASKYAKSHDNVSEATIDDVNNWANSENDLINKTIPKEGVLTAIQCPVDVKVYNKDGRQIAYLRDHNSEIDPLYRHLFLTCCETKEAERQEGNDYPLEESKAKLLILPNDGSITFEIIGANDGIMDISSYYIENSDSNDWINEQNLVFNATNVKVKPNRIYKIEKSGDKYDLRQTKAISSGWKIVLMLIPGILITCIIVILAFKRKK